MNVSSPSPLNATILSSLFDPDALIPNPVQYPIYYTQNPTLISGLRDHHLALVTPIVVYWGYSLFFHILDLDIFQWPAKYRIHESEEVKSKNLASPRDVFLAVVLQHIIQTLLGIFWLEESLPHNDFEAMRQLSIRLSSFTIKVFGQERGGVILQTAGPQFLSWLYWWGIPLAQFFFAMFIIDTWQYFIHRAMHINKTMYKYLHSVHHRLYAPYAYGALYNNPIEGLIMDSFGAALAEFLASLTSRQAILLFGLSTLKTVDDHCGYSLPWDPLQLLCRNNADYHDIHHQTIGIKYNFSQPWFVHWDVLLGTRMTRQDMEEKRRPKNKEKTI